MSGAYLRWLGRRLGFRRVNDWNAVRADDFNSNHGSGLTSIFGGYRNVLRHVWPSLAASHAGVGRKGTRLGPRPLRPRHGPWRRHRLTARQILRWADAHRRKTSRWPLCTTAASPDGSAEGTWRTIDDALRLGRRGLPGGSSLAKLLAAERGAQNRLAPPRLSVRQILRWADEHRQRTGRWPRLTSGRVSETVDETWTGIHRALYVGLRGLPGGSSLARLLAAARGVPNRQSQPRLTVREILRWADAHHRRTGQWPRCRSTPPPDGATGSTWSAIDDALRRRLRGLQGGSSLARLLAAEREVPNSSAPPRLSVRQILAWADRHRRFTGKWPNAYSGRVSETVDETWTGIHQALYVGLRRPPRRLDAGEASHQGTPQAARQLLIYSNTFSTGMMRMFSRLIPSGKRMISSSSFKTAGGRGAG